MILIAFNSPEFETLGSRKDKTAVLQLSHLLFPSFRFGAKFEQFLMVINTAVLSTAVPDFCALRGRLGEKFWVEVPLSPSHLVPSQDPLTGH